MILTVFAGMNLQTVSAYDKEDGDIVENPWVDEQREDSGSGNLPLEKESTQNVGTGSTQNTGGNSSGGSQVTAKQYKKTLKTKFASVTRKKTKAKITLQKSGNAKGYQIRYSTNKKFKKAATKNYKKNKFTLKKLQKGKRYYIKARAYGVWNGVRVYGAWTGRKVLKAK